MALPIAKRFVSGSFDQNLHTQGAPFLSRRQRTQ